MALQMLAHCLLGLLLAATESSAFAVSSTTSRPSGLFAAARDGRRDFLESSAASSIAVAILATIGPSPALAKSGDSASMAVPGIGSYIDFLIESNEKQATLDAKVLSYKGADPSTQLRRLSDAAARLSEIRGLAGDKKWSQVQGLINGPLGTLLQTMNTVVGASGGQKNVKVAAASVKADIFSIGQSATKKSSEDCIQYADMAIADLKTFVEAAFGN